MYAIKLHFMHLNYGVHVDNFFYFSFFLEKKLIFYHYRQGLFRGEKDKLRRYNIFHMDLLEREEDNWWQ